VLDTPVVPVFQAVLPNGKVLIWDSVGDNAAESYPNHTFTRVMVWNPADDTYKRVDLKGNNIFCAGFAHRQRRHPGRRREPERETPGDRHHVPVPLADRDLDARQGHGGRPVVPVGGADRER